MTSATYTVTGMTCDHCVRAVHDELAALPGVSTVDVRLDGGQVTITSAQPLAEDAVRSAIDEAGYELAGRGPG